MLHPIKNSTNFTSITSILHPKEKKENKSKYHDPLNNWWVKGATYTNEIGTTIHEISPRLAQILWIPSIMYLGADIYDKYKNDKNHYKPSGKRGIERVIYQGVAGFLLPSGAIYLGQKLTSPVIKLFNRGLSVNARENTLKHMRDAVNQCIGDMYDDKKRFKDFMLNSLENKITSCRNEKQTDGFLKKIIKFNSGAYALANEDKIKIFDFANKNINKLFDVQQTLRKGKKPKEISNSCYKKYLREVPVLRKMYGQDNANHAIGFVLKHYESKQLLKTKILKTIGGLISLAVLLKPIDYFVSKILMPKFVDPGITRFNAALLERSSLKSHIKNIEQKQQQKQVSFTDSAQEKSRNSSPEEFQKLEEQLPLNPQAEEIPVQELQ